VNPGVPAASPPTARSGDRSFFSRVSPLVLVGLAVAWSLWSLRAERLVVSYPNDSALHLQMTALAGHWLAHGSLAFGHWYPNLSTGSPFFAQYQSASAVLASALGLLVGYPTTLAWTLYLLLALWPVCVYATGRLLEWGRWESAVAATLAPLLTSVTLRGFGHEAYVWLGNGLWSQLWAMWTLPLAVAFSWRFVSRREYLFGAVAAAGATIAFHFLMAYLLGLILVIFVVLRPSDVLGRLLRAALVGAGALAATLWVTVPLLVDAKWTAIDEFQVHTTIADSFGAPLVLRWLVTGRLLDNGRLPVLTILAAAGLVACVARWRADERGRVLVGIFALSLVLFSGRPTFGFLLNTLPLNDNLLFNRFVAGVQLASLFLGGVGAVAIVRVGADQLRRRAPAGRAMLSPDAKAAVLAPLAAICAVVVVLAPAWLQIGRYDASNAVWIGWQRGQDASRGSQVQALLALAEHRGGGRVYAGMPSNWGSRFFVGAVPVYNYMEDTPVDAVGLTLRTSALMTGPEAYFDESDPGDYTVLGIRYLLLPAGHAPPVAATLVAGAGHYRLWTVRSTGLVHVIETWLVIPADRTNLGARTKPIMDSEVAAEGIFPTIAFAGGPAATPTLGTLPAHSTSAGTVRVEHDAVIDGRVTAVVTANRVAVVALASSFDPGWSVRVDGRPAAPEMIAPAIVGVKVRPGTHLVVFQWRGYGSYPFLFLVAVLTLVAAALGPLLWRRSSRRRGHGADRAR